MNEKEERKFVHKLDVLMVLIVLLLILGGAIAYRVLSNVGGDGEVVLLFMGLLMSVFIPVGSLWLISYLWGLREEHLAKIKTLIDSDKLVPHH